MAENVNITIKAFDKTKKGFGSVTAGLKKVTGAVFSMRTALVGVAGVAGFGLLVKSSLSATDSLAKTASKIGTTTEALSGLRFAAEITGVATTTMDMALQRFTRRTAEAAKGTGEAKGAIRELGINAQELNRLPLDKRMLVLADAFSNVESESDRLRLAFKLFDSEGAALVNTLSLGREGLSELLGEAKALGVVMSSDAAKGVENATDSLTKLKAITKGLRDQFVAALAPAIESLTTKFTDFFKKIAEKKGGVEQFARDMAKAFLNATLAVVQSLDTILTNVGKTFNAFKSNVSKFQKVAQEINLKSFEQQAVRLQEALDIVFHEKRPLTLGERLKAGLDKANPSVLEITRRFMEVQAQINEVEAKMQSGLTPIDLSNVIDVEGFENVINMLLGNIDKLSSAPKLDVINPEEIAEAKQLVTVFDRLQASFKNIEETFPSLDEGMQKVAKSMSGAITKGFTDAITGAQKFSDAMKAMAKSVVDSLIEMLVQYYITQSLFGLITGTPFPTQNQTTAPIREGVPLPPKAIGGSVQAGQPYMVGERGTELFVPNQSGSIVSNKNLGGGNGVVVQQTINVTTGVQQTVRAEIVQLMPQIAQAAKGAVADARLRGGNFSKAMAGA
jgi:hypothetical protein